jgi:lipopolysaccharide/colanic/teichoic acid biosynthesis glycosyltransferase
MQGLNLELEETRGSATCAAFDFEPATDAERQLILSGASSPRADRATERESSRPDVRRVIDIVASLILIFLLAPLLILIALVILVNDPGPPVFAHYRVGKTGKPFRCLKFRSMCVDAQARLEKMLEEDPVLRAEWERGHKLAKDPRVTRIGHLLRVSSLDELPQLFNVLWGNMTLVGPRPIVTAEIPQYGRFASYYFGLKPGLTGLWQVTGRSSVSYRRRVAADVLYARTRSLGLDIRILLTTVPAVLFGWGAC